MARFNYHWSAKKQKKKVEDHLLSYLTDVIAKYSPFYREWFEKHNINVNDINSLEDFQKIPPTLKSEHMENPAKFILQPYQPDWWECRFETDSLPAVKSIKYWLQSLNKTSLRAVFNKDPVNEDEEIIMQAVKEWLPIQFLNTGHSVSPALIAYTKHDIMSVLPEIIGQIYLTGFRTHWEVFNIMSPEPSINFFQSIWSPLTIGGGTFFTCDEEDTSLDQQVDIASSITFEVFFGKPSETKNWLKHAISKIGKKKDKRIESFKLCILTGEPMTLKQKEEIKSLFGKIGSTPKIIESYSNNRAKASFYECTEGAGIHLNPRYFYWEVLDPKTLTPVPEGESGVLCFSHIDWRGTAFIRYVTGDLCSGITWEKCDKCNLVFPIIKGPIKRT